MEENRIQDTVSTAMNSIMDPSIETVVRSKYLSSGRDLASVVAVSSECEEQADVTTLLCSHAKETIYSSKFIHVLRFEDVILMRQLNFQSRGYLLTRNRQLFCRSLTQNHKLTDSSPGSTLNLANERTELVINKLRFLCTRSTFFHRSSAVFSFLWTTIAQTQKVHGLNKRWHRRCKSWNGD